MSRRGTMMMAFVAATLAAGSLEAQRPQRRGGGQERAELERRIRARFGEMMRERLGLTEEQGEAHRLAERFARAEQALRRRVEALMLEGGEDNEEALDLLERMATLREDEAALFRAEQVRLLEVLEPVQLLQFQAMREQMGQQIRRLRGGQGRIRGPEGWIPRRER